jgi:hypothetical protein
MAGQITNGSDEAFAEKPEGKCCGLLPSGTARAHLFWPLSVMLILCSRLLKHPPNPLLQHPMG